MIYSLGKSSLIPRNAAAVQAPSPAPEEMRPLSEAEARAFLKAARESGDRFEALYVLAITTGLRRGELLGLRWDDADLKQGTQRTELSIRRSSVARWSPHRFRASWPPALLLSLH